MVRAFGHLGDAEGDGVAVPWLRAAVPAGMENPASVFLFDEGHDELLWTLIPDPEAGPNPSSVWLMRAAAFVRAGADGAAHEAPLIDHFSADVDDPYHRIGRYLLGLDDEAEVLALAAGPDRLCEVAYYLGLKAQSEGRLTDAAAWYRVALDTGQATEFEYQWAVQSLARWEARARSLEALAREPQGAPRVRTQAAR